MTRIGGCTEKAADYCEIPPAEGSVVDLPRDIKLFDVFEEYDRFAFPEGIYRVTGGHGGEAILLCGREKTALLDCGMAYCAEVTLRNIIHRLSALGRQSLDYILLSHSHYDHIGALPWIKEAYPAAVVCGSEHCAQILTRPGAHALMKELGENALQLYEPGSTREIRTDGLAVDQVLADGDLLLLGEGERITCLETKGHTDCSMSFFLEPCRVLFASESTGIIEGKVGKTPDGRGYIHTPVLKDFSQALDSMRKCRDLHPAGICLPHFGMVPQGMRERYWEDFAAECEDKIAYARLLKAGNLTEEEMLDRYSNRYWTTFKAMEQPKEAFLINSKYILRALLKEIDRRDNHGI